MTTPLPAPLPPAVRKWLGVLVDIGDADAGRPGSGRAVYELLYGLCCEVYRERLPSGDAPPDDLHARKLGEGLTWELANACGYLGEDEHPSWGVLIAALRAGFCQGPNRQPLTWVEGAAPQHGLSEAMTLLESCTCDTNPETTDGPDYDCPLHGVPAAPPQPPAGKSPVGWDPSCWTGEDPEHWRDYEPGEVTPKLVRHALEWALNEVREHTDNYHHVSDKGELAGAQRCLDESEGAAHPQPTPDAMTRGAEAIICAWVEAGEPTDKEGRALIAFDLDEVLAPYSSPPPSEPDAEMAQRHDSLRERVQANLGTTEPPATERDPDCPLDHLGPCHHEHRFEAPRAEPSQTPDAPGWWWLDAFGDGEWAPAWVTGLMMVKRASRLEYEHVDEIDDDQWDGRCTRGAQADDGLRKRVQAVLEECRSCELCNGGLGYLELDGRAKAWGAAADYIEAALRGQTPTEKSP